MRRATTIAALAIAGLASTLQAQSIDPDNRFAWNENAGLINFAAGSDKGVEFNGDHLAGHLWCENIGWVHLGDGPLFSGGSSNSIGSDTGVNIGADDTLTGLAWGENVGWINFAGGSLADPPNPARIDTANGRLAGYAWGENIGWINLDDTEVFVGVIPAGCSCDFDDNGTIDILDLLEYLSGWFPLNGALVVASPIDVNGDGFVSVVDMLEFLACWFDATSDRPCT